MPKTLLEKQKYNHIILNDATRLYLTSFSIKTTSLISKIRLKYYSFMHKMPYKNNHLTILSCHNISFEYAAICSLVYMLMFSHKSILY